MAIVQTAEIFPEYKGKIWVKPFRATVRGIFKTVFRTKIRGMEKIESLKGQPMVIVADHTSMFDGALLAATLPVDAMYAIDTYQYEKFKRHPIFGPLMDSVEMYTLDPANTKSIDRMTEKVKAGKPLVIFPEGTLTSTGSFMPIESLAAQLSARAGAWV
ncbi:MAG TPA: 1-acyl-sn-glycerol-3-phosphate acyltransferase, partial [Alphaproteobacteria bacterium]